MDENQIGQMHICDKALLGKYIKQNNNINKSVVK